MNFTQNKHGKFGLNKNKEIIQRKPIVFIHHDKIIENVNFERKYFTNFLTDKSIIVKKSSHNYLSKPFGSCIDYSIPNALTYYGMSHYECYRKCLFFEHKKQWNCIPYVMFSFITEYDLIDNITKICRTNIIDEIKFKQEFARKYFSEKCLKRCPKDCFQVEYLNKVLDLESYLDNKQVNNQKKNNLFERNILWDTSEPMFAYIDEPVMTFTQYLVYCGGLMGLWFGQSVKDLFTILFDISFWRSLENRFFTMYHIMKIKIIFTFTLILNLISFIIELFINFFKNIFNLFIKFLIFIKRIQL